MIRRLTPYLAPIVLGLLIGFVSDLAGCNDMRGADAAHITSEVITGRNHD